MKLGKVLAVLTATAMILPGLCLAESRYNDYGYTRNWNYMSTYYITQYALSVKTPNLPSFQVPKTNIDLNRTTNNLNKFVIMPTSYTSGLNTATGSFSQVKVNQSPGVVTMATPQNTIVFNTQSVTAVPQDQGTYDIRGLKEIDIKGLKH